MPVINMSITDLSRLVGEDFNLKEFTDRIPMIGASVEKIEGDEISVEFFPNRPDLFSVEGVARAYRRFQKGSKRDLFKRFFIESDTDMVLKVDQNIQDIRPIIGGAYIEGVALDEYALISIMNLQEKLHLSLGRKRKKVAIGIHDADPIKAPFTYWASDPEEVSFVPLQKEGEWNLRRILKEHEKGIDYAWTLEDFDRYPMITDSEDNVLSFPPIINGELTRVTTATKNIFVDCTGTDLKAVSLAVNIVCSQLADRGGRIRSIRIDYPDTDYYRDLKLRSERWPRYSWAKHSLDLVFARSWLGIHIPERDIKESLYRMGYEDIHIEDDRIKCIVPPWRSDLLHPADIAEDIAIGYGFENFPGARPHVHTTGSERRITTMGRIIKETMVGLGFLEVRTISLSNEDDQFRLTGRVEHPHVRIINPITTEHTMMRMSALPTLMNLLHSNRHRDLPQKIFEAADVMVGNLSRVLLTGVSADNRASYTEMKGTVQRILSDIGVSYVIDSASDLKFYIPGRAAALMVEIPDIEGYEGPFPELITGKMIPIGHFGEMDPSLISEMELSSPVTGFELDLTLITDHLVDI
ncbi:MAG: phenylalanine--tRNA ligase subunit beta [Thermoplasmatota archaeon]